MKCQPAQAAPPEQRNGDQDESNLQSGQQHDDQAGGGNQQRGAQVRLGDDHGGRNGDQHAHDEQIPEGRRQRPLVHVPGAHHRHRQLHDLGGLKAHEADIEPALRALADVAGDIDHDQQQHTDHIGDGREQAQILRGRELGERQHARRPRCAMFARWCSTIFQFCPEALYTTRMPMHDDDGQYARQRTVQPERAQGAAAGGQGAAGAGRREFIVNHALSAHALCS